MVAHKRYIDRQDVVIGQIGATTDHLRSLLCAIKSIVLCTFICKVGYFDAQIRETLLFQVGGLMYLPL